MEPREVLKLGGWSVKDPESIRKSAKIVMYLLDSGKRLVVVPSAMKGMTDVLIEAAGEVSLGADISRYVGKNSEILERYESASKELKTDTSYGGNLRSRLESGLHEIARARTLNPELQDQVASLGEFGMSELLNLYFKSMGVNSVVMHPSDLEAVCDGNFGNARLKPEYDLIIKRRIDEQTADVVVIDGYYYITKEGKMATIGRGGSDKAAVDYAVRINSPIVRIGGDTNGVMSADPKVVPSARTVATLCYEEAMACSAHGAKVLHPRAIHPVLDRGLSTPIQVFNTFEDDGVYNREKYTMIECHVEADEQNPIKVINHLEIPWVVTVRSHVMYDIEGFNDEYTAILRRNRAKVLFTIEDYQTNTSLIMNDIISNDIAEEMRQLIRQYGGKPVGDTVTFGKDSYSLVTLVGEGIRHFSGLTGRVGTILGKNTIKIRGNSSALDAAHMPYLVGREHAYDAVNLLHEEFCGVK